MRKSILKITSKFIIMTLIFLKTNYTSANLNIFNLQDHGYDVVTKYKNYRKTKGFLDAFIYGLSVVPKGIIVDNYLSKENIIEIKNHLGNLFMCRPDAPLKDWYSLPRGKDLKPEEINMFLKECRKINPKSILLCFLHPSIYFTGNLVERYKISGAINILIDWGNIIEIEYVGKGFDCGELSRGINQSHTLINIPWMFVYWPPAFIWDYSIIKNISQNEYNNSRFKRICKLSNMGYSENELEVNIPKFPKHMEKKIFCEIYEKSINKLIKFENDFDKKTPIMIMINLYGNQQHVFEIWSSIS